MVVRGGERKQVLVTEPHCLKIIRGKLMGYLVIVNCNLMWLSTYLNGPWMNNECYK